MQRNSVYFLVFSVFGLIVLGMVMLFSTSAFAKDCHGDIYYFIKRQGMWLVIGCIACTVAAVLDYRIWMKTWWIWMGGSVILLALCFVPPIGMRINGAWRWLNFGVMSFQPSEMAKIAAVIFLAWWFTKYEKKSSGFIHGFLAPLCIVGAMLTLIVFEVDLGTTILIAGTAFAVIFVAGCSMKWLLPVILLSLCGVAYAVTHIEERAGRMLAFLHPERYRLSEGLQQWQALIALGSGGVEGLGLGEGRQKLFYLPYAHTDFIFPMIGEELGLRFTLLTVFGFLLIALCGALIASNARDRFGMLLGFGLVMLLVLQSAINIGVTTSLLPNKGMPLPFISYGGSNLLVCLFMIGILISIHRHGRFVERPKKQLLLAARMNTR